MSLLKGTQTFRRFRLTQPIPDDYRERLAKYTHRPMPDSRSKQPIGGGVAIDDETAGPILPNYGQALAMAVRVDRKRVPSRALKRAVDARCLEIRRERGLERLGKNHRREIAEAVEEELLG